MLVVPNAALRWSPQPTQIAPEARSKSRDHTEPSTPDREGVSGDGGTMQVHGTIWVAEGKFVRPVHVNVGMTDGVLTEIEGRDVTEGLQAVVGEMTAESQTVFRCRAESVCAPNGPGQALKDLWI